jgi:hypothetical protein
MKALVSKLTPVYTQFWRAFKNRANSWRSSIAISAIEPPSENPKFQHATPKKL